MADDNPTMRTLKYTVEGVPKAQSDVTQLTNTVVQQDKRTIDSSDNRTRKLIENEQKILDAKKKSNSVQQVADNVDTSAKVIKDTASIRLSDQNRILSRLERMQDPIGANLKTVDDLLGKAETISQQTGPNKERATGLLATQSGLDRLKTSGLGDEVVKLTADKTAIQSVSDTFVKISKDIRATSEEMERLNKIIEEGGPLAASAANTITAAQKATQKNLDDIRVKYDAARKSAMDLEQTNAKVSIQKVSDLSVPTSSKNIRSASEDLEKLNKLVAEGGPLATEAQGAISAAQNATQKNLENLRVEYDKAAESASNLEKANNRASIQKTNDVFAPYSKSIKSASDELERLDKIISEGGPLAEEAQGAINAAQKTTQKNLEGLRSDYDKAARAAQELEQSTKSGDIQKAADMYVPYTKEIRVATEALEKLNKTVAEGGPEAQNAAKITPAIQKKLDDLKVAQAKVTGVATPAASNDNEQRNIERLTQTYAPYLRAVEKAKEDLSALNELSVRGGPQAAAAIQLIPLAQKKLVEAEHEATKAANDNAEGVKRTASAHDQLSTHAQSAFHAIRGFTEQVAFGIPITRAAVSEFNNISYAMSGKGGLTGALTEVIGLFGRFLVPVAGIAAIGAAFLIVGQRVLTVHQNLKDFNAVLNTSATGSQVSAAGLQKITDDFIKLGVSADDAKKSVLAVLGAKSQGINTNFTKDIIQTALDIQAIPTSQNFGNLPATVKDLTDAMIGGVESIKEYGLRLGALDGETLDTINKQNLLYGATKAVDTGFGLIKEKVKDAYINSLDSGKNVTIALTNAWRGFVNAIAESKFVEGIENAITGLLTSFTSLIGKLDKLGTWISDKGTVVTNFFQNLVPANGLNKLIEFISKFNDYYDIVKKITELPPTAAREDLAQAITERGGSKSDVKAMTTDKPTVGSAVTTTLARGTAVTAPINPTSQEDLNRLTDGLKDSINLFKSDLSLQEKFTNDMNQRFEKASEGFKALSTDKIPKPGKRTFGIQAEKANTTITSPDLAQTNQKTNQTTETVIQTTIRLKDTQKLARLEAEDRLRVEKLFPPQLQIETAGLEAFWQEIHKTGIETDANAKKQEAIRIETEKVGIENEKVRKIDEDLAKGTGATTEAYNKNEVAGLKAAAASQAHQESLTSNIPEQQLYNKILTQNAADAILSAQKEVTSFNQVLAANTRLVEGTKKGVAAEKDAELQNEAVRATHDALNAAKATGIKTSEDYAKKLQDEKLAQLRNNEALVQTADLQRDINKLKDENKVTQLEITLTSSGAVQEKIDTAVNNLRAQLKLQNESASATKETKDLYTDIVNKQGQWNEKLENVRQQQRRINDLFISIADSISSNLTSAIDDAFDGKKPKAWGETVKGVLKDIVKEAADKLFIKPVLGSLANTLGLGEASKSLGTISSTTGNGTGLTTGNTGTGTQTTTRTTDSSGNTVTSTTSSGIGGNSITGLLGLGSSTGSTDSVVDWLNTKIGPSLGFAKPATTITSVESDADLGGGISTTAAETGLLGTSTTLTSGLGGALSGLGAGSLTSSLLGGNKVGGSIGGLVGGIAGSFIPIPGGSLIGGAIGGAIGGLFGNSKKSNDAAGTDVNLTTGAYSRTVKSADSQSNSDVSDIASSLKSFAKTLRDDTKGAILDNVQIQAGARDGIKVSYKGVEKKFSTAQDAIDQLELDISKNLTGVSDTMKTVLNNVTDASDISDAVAFAADYDKLKKSADDAFGSISTDTDKIGPYAQAYQDLTDTFDKLTTSAEEFGLSLDPINKGLDEAKKRLKEDFGKSLDAAFDTSSAKDYINTLQDVADAYRSNIKEANAIGLGTDTKTTDKLAELEVSKAKETIDTLTPHELATAYTDLKDTAPEVATQILDAMHELRDGFDSTITSSSAKDYIKTLKDVSKAYTSNIQDAVALGLTDSTTLSKISKLEVTDAKATLETLNRSDLEYVVDALKTTNPEISDLAQSILDMGGAADDAGASVTTLATGLKDIKDELKDLRSGKSAGLTDTGTAKAALKDYQTDLKKAQDAGASVTGTELDALALSAKAVVDAYTTAYGNAPKTADLRRQTIKDLDAIVALAKDTKNTVVPSSVAADQNTLAKKTLTTGSDVTISAGVAADQATVLTDTLAKANDTTTTAAVGSVGTPPGKILVGELGPEWMLPKFESGTQNWVKVGMGGPEIIDQKGGAVILPFPMHPKEVMGFAKGTDKETWNDNTPTTMMMTNNVMGFAKGTQKEKETWMMDRDKEKETIINNSKIMGFAGGTEKINKMRDVSLMSSSVMGFAGGTNKETWTMGGTNTVTNKVVGFVQGTGIEKIRETNTTMVMPSMKFAGGTINTNEINNTNNIVGFSQGTLEEKETFTNNVMRFANGTENTWIMGGMENTSGSSTISNSNNTNVMGFAGGTIEKIYETNNNNNKMSMGPAGKAMGFARGIMPGTTTIDSWPLVSNTNNIIGFASGTNLEKIYETNRMSVGPSALIMGFAGGTIDNGGTVIDSLPPVSGSVSADSLPSSGDWTNDSYNTAGQMIIELKGLRKDNLLITNELGALKKQVQGGQTQAMDDARRSNSNLSSINNKLGSGLVAPARRAVG